jgi:hypothetical protein
MIDAMPLLTLSDAIIDIIAIIDARLLADGYAID